MDLLEGGTGDRPDAAGEAKQAAGDGIVLADGVAKPGGCRLHLFVIDEKDAELVAADPADDVAASKCGPHELGEIPKQSVTLFMAEVVVDLLQPVDVDKQDRYGRLISASPGQMVLGPQATSAGAGSIARSVCAMKRAWVVLSSTRRIRRGFRASMALNGSAPSGRT